MYLMHLHIHYAYLENRFKTNFPDFQIVPETEDKINEIISSVNQVFNRRENLARNV